MMTLEDEMAEKQIEELPTQIAGSSSHLLPRVGVLLLRGDPGRFQVVVGPNRLPSRG